MPLKGTSVEANDLTGTLLEAIIFGILRLIAIWGTLSLMNGVLNKFMLKADYYQELYFDWFIYNGDANPVNKNTVVSIWGLVPNFSLFNTTTFCLTTQSMACWDQLSCEKQIHLRPIWDDPLPCELSLLQKSRYTLRYTSCSSWNTCMQVPQTHMFTVDTPSPPFITVRLRSLQHPVNKNITHLHFSSTAWMKFMVLSSTKSQCVSSQGRLQG